MFNINRLSILMFILYNYIYVTNVSAVTIYAKSCSSSDVQSAINFASDGDTVKIPSGDCTWSEQVTIPNTKGITLMGAGIDNTTIRNGYSSGGMLYISNVEGKPFRVTGILFRGAGGSNTNGTIQISGTCKNWRIDHCNFYILDSRIIKISNWNFGLIDHCNFTCKKQAIYVTTSQWGNESYGDGSWSEDAHWGTEIALYIEDCEFDDVSGSYGHGFIDMGYGARVVIRYCTFKNEQIVTHGTDTSQRMRSFRTLEVYNCEMHDSTRFGIPSPILIRGGTAVIYNNSAYGGFKSGVAKLWLKRETTFCSPWGKADDTPDWWCSNSDTWCDEYGDCSSGTCTRGPVDVHDPENDTLIAVIDQPGHGKDSGVLTSQAIEPIYEWNNTLNGADADIAVQSNLGVIRENTHYYNDTQMPGYTAYAYPHPLTITIQNPPPAPPSNLRVVK